MINHESKNNDSAVKDDKLFEERRAVIKGLIATGVLLFTAGCAENSREEVQRTPFPTESTKSPEDIFEPPTLTPPPTIAADQEPVESNYFQNVEQLKEEYKMIRDQFWQEYGIDPQLQNILLVDRIPNSEGVMIIDGFMPGDEPWATIDLSHNLYLRDGTLERFEKEQILSILYFSSALSLIRESKDLSGGREFFGFSETTIDTDGEGIVDYDRSYKFFTNKAYAFVMANNVSLKGPHSLNSMLNVINYYPPNERRYMLQATLVTFLLLDLVYNQSFFTERDMYVGLADKFSQSQIIEFLRRLLKIDEAPLNVADLKNFNLLYQETREQYLSKEGIATLLFSYLNRYEIRIDDLGPDIPKVDPLGDSV